MTTTTAATSSVFTTAEIKRRIEQMFADRDGPSAAAEA